MEAGSPRTGSPLRPLIVVTFCLYFGFGLTMPVLPLFARDLGASGAIVGLTVAAFGIASFSFDLAGGRLSDRVGVRRAAAGGGLIVLCSALVGWAAPNVWVLLLARLATGAGSAIYVTTAMNVLARTTPPDRMGRSMGAYQSALQLSIAVGPVAGGALAEALGFRPVFLLHAAIAGAGVLVCLRALPRALPRPEPRYGEGAAGGFSEVLRDGAFQTALAVAFVVFILRAGVSSTAVPLYAHEELGLSRGRVGLALALTALSNLIFLRHAGRLADRRPRAVAILVGLAATLLGLGLLAFWQTELGLYVAMVVVGCATAYAGVTPAVVITDVTPPAHSATAMGLYRMAIDSGNVAGPVAAGVLVGSAGTANAFLLMSLPALLTLAATFRQRDTRRMTQRAEAVAG